MASVVAGIFEMAKRCVGVFIRNRYVTMKRLAIPSILLGADLLSQMPHRAEGMRPLNVSLADPNLSDRRTGISIPRLGQRRRSLKGPRGSDC